jgi:hypothetical protein
LIKRDTPYNNPKDEKACTYLPHLRTVEIQYIKYCWCWVQIELKATQRDLHYPRYSLSPWDGKKKRHSAPPGHYASRLRESTLDSADPSGLPLIIFVPSIIHQFPNSGRVRVLKVQIGSLNGGD